MAYWSANTGGGFLSGILGTPTYGIGTYTSTGTTLGGIGAGTANSGYSNVVFQQQAAQFQLPPPSGTLVPWSYIDPYSKQTLTINVDQSYIPILNQIVLLQYGIMNQYPLMRVPSQQMPDGEFSLDEMDKAKDIILEIEHDKAA